MIFSFFSDGWVDFPCVSIEPCVYGFSHGWTWWLFLYVGRYKPCFWECWAAHCFPISFLGIYIQGQFSWISWCVFLEDFKEPRCCCPSDFLAIYMPDVSFRSIPFSPSPFLFFGAYRLFEDVSSDQWDVVPLICTSVIMWSGEDLYICFFFLL